jgi:PAS domain S-box-containing protein
MTVAGVALALITVASLLFALRTRRAAAAAREVGGRYETLAAHMPDVSVMLYDRELRFTLLEGSAMQAHGWRREDFEGRPIEDTLPAERRDAFLAHCRAALAGESSTHDWVGLRDPSRLYRNVHVPVRDARGAIVGGMMVVRDVTDSEALRRASEAQRGFLAGVIEQLSDHVVVADAEGRLQGTDELMGGNPACARARSQVGGPLDWPEHFGLRDAEGRARLTPAEVPLFRALQGETVEGMEVTLEQPGGELRTVVASARPVRDVAGRTIGAVGTGIDVTDRRVTEARLRASEERYRSVVESVNDIVFQTDLSGRWAFLNESWARWSGVPVADALGRYAYELVHPGDRAAHARAFAPLVTGEVDSVHLRHRYLTAEGVTRWAEVRASLARDSAGRPHGIAGVIEDVTERHRTKQYEAAEQAVVEVLAHSVDIEAGVAAILEQLCRHLDWDLAELWTFDSDREVLHLTDVWGGERRAGLEALEAAAVGETFEVGDGIQGQAWARRTPIWVSGLQEDPLFRRGAAAAAAGVRSALALPVMRGREVLATILFFAREERDPDPALARLLQTIGAHLAQFLERRRAERSLAERSTQVERLEQLLADLHGSLTPERAALLDD